MINVYSGVTPKGAIDPLLWKVTTDQLNKAVDKAFGAVKFGEVNYDFVNRLKYNNGVFSAFKNHKQGKLLQKQLSDGKGVKSFAQFKKDTKSIVGDYNKRYLKTEYNTAVLSSRSAHNFKRYESKLYLYPNVEYLPSRSPQPRQAHRPFYHTILPYNHPWWDTHTPPLDWNCKCGHSNTDADVSAVPDDGDIKVADGLDNNPAKSEKLFADSHPYIEKTRRKDSKSILQQADKFLRNTTRQFARDWGKQQIKNPVKGLKIKVDNVPDGFITLRNSDIKSITGKPHKLSYYRNLLIPDLEEVFKDAIYLESKSDNPNHSHANVLEWLYYEIEFQGEKSYVSVMRDVKNEYRIHAISDTYKKQ